MHALYVRTCFFLAPTILFRVVLGDRAAESRMENVGARTVRGTSSAGPPPRGGASVPDAGKELVVVANIRMRTLPMSNCCSHGTLLHFGLAWVKQLLVQILVVVAPTRLGAAPGTEEDHRAAPDPPRSHYSHAERKLAGYAGNRKDRLGCGRAAWYESARHMGTRMGIGIRITCLCRGVIAGAGTGIVIAIDADI